MKMVKVTTYTGKQHANGRSKIRSQHRGKDDRSYNQKMIIGPNHQEISVRRLRTW